MIIEVLGEWCHALQPKPVWYVRQERWKTYQYGLLAPDMLVTNRSGNNIAIKLNDLSIDAQVVGVVIPGSVEDEAHTGA